jgi:heme-degrading monooxygenase HmoA
MFVILWEFEVKRGHEGEFEKKYGPGGVWAQFFAKDAAYRGTRLARDTSDARRYYTVDLWASREAYEAFRERNEEEYKRLDTQCEAMTVDETRLGMFED